jgi:hypothetical protein
MAAQQHGVVDHAQLVAAGLTTAAIKHRVAAGWLYRKHRRVYAVGHPRLTQQGRWMAAVLSGGDEAVLSHRSAGALWGICLDAPFPEITAPLHSRAGRIVYKGTIRPGETLRVDGIRVTKVGRTLLDLAEVLTLDQLVSAIDKATNSRRLGRTTMSSVMKRSPGRRGLKPLKQALLITRPQDVLTRSELERRALRLIAQAGLPTPEVNVCLHGYEVDLLWRPDRLVVELDGREHHEHAFERDRRRDADLLSRGWRVLRLTWRQVVNDPAWVVEVISGCAPTGAEGP